jgi:hypothetical protein
MQCRDEAGRTGVPCLTRISITPSLLQGSAKSAGVHSVAEAHRAYTVPTSARPLHLRCPSSSARDATGRPACAEAHRLSKRTSQFAAVSSERALALTLPSARPRQPVRCTVRRTVEPAVPRMAAHKATGKRARGWRHARRLTHQHAVLRPGWMDTHPSSQRGTTERTHYYAPAPQLDPIVMSEDAGDVMYAIARHTQTRTAHFARQGR